MGHLLQCLNGVDAPEDIRTLKQISCVVVIALCPRQVWWNWVHAPLRTVR